MKTSSPQNDGKGFDEQRHAIERQLHQYVDSAMSSGPVSVAMHHAVHGGHRWRALLLMCVYQAITGRSWHDVMDCACAIELIHASSLIVDDLPCIDDAELRRGTRACHRAHGEAVAIYASHVLVALADRIAARRARQSPGDYRLSVTFANGRRDLVKGQMLEAFLTTSLGDADRDTLLRLSALKGVLFRTAGAVAGRAARCSPATFKAVLRFASEVGTMYQVADDIADATLLASTVGKPVGMDAAKRNLVVMNGPAAAKEVLEALYARALIPVRATLPRIAYVVHFLEEMHEVGVSLATPVQSYRFDGNVHSRRAGSPSETPSNDADTTGRSIIDMRRVTGCG